ncbi:MAG: hypothetical protein WD176_04635 [Pirellulales bacterium]
MAKHFVTWLLIFVCCAALGRAEPRAPEPVTAPPAAATIGPKPKPAPPRDAQAVEAAMQRGIAFLIRAQNKDGSWGSARRTKGSDVYAPVPGAHHAFRAATTALCISALIEVGGEKSDVREAIDRGEKWMLGNLPMLRRAEADTIYNVWGHGFGIQALVRLERRNQDAAAKTKIRELIASQVERLLRYEFVTGGWGYYDFHHHAQKPATMSTSFTTATCLVALHEARALGIEVPQKTIDRAIAAIKRQRKPDFSYLYAHDLRQQPMRDINRPGGSLGRSQACNYALRLWGDEQVTDAVLVTWLDRLFARGMWLDIGRKRPIPHESWFAVAAYFYYYGYYYASLCIEQLPEAQRGPHLDQLAHTLLARQEKDGSWWDFPLYDYHQPYGTAFALMTLHRCRAKP